MKEWLTVKEAALVAQRHERTIYRWIDDGKLVTREAGDGSLEVMTDEVRDVESTTRRGRPHGSPTRQ